MKDTRKKKELIYCFKNTISKGHLVLTKEVSDFENQINKYTNTKFCVGLNSGTDALMMALWVKGIKKGDEVITTSKSFVATAGAISHLGAKPVYVDIGDDLNINPNLIENKITKKFPLQLVKEFDMDYINKIGKK